MEGEEFPPGGAPLLLLALVLLALLLLGLALAARRGGPPRNPATADDWEMRSLIWTSESTWQAAHRASAPFLFAASAGLACAAATGAIAAVVFGWGPSAPISLGGLVIALFWVIGCCILAWARGRSAARRVLRTAAD